jgi:hypothetical protein
MNRMLLLVKGTAESQVTLIGFQVCGQLFLIRSVHLQITVQYVVGVSAQKSRAIGCWS